MRLEIKQGINNCLLINDYYNSDLNSLSIALSVLQQQAAKVHLRKTIILSDIQQTGIPKTELYAQVNKLLNEWKIDELIGIGPEISEHSYLFSGEKRFYPVLDDFEKTFQKEDFKEAVILIKRGPKIYIRKNFSIVTAKIASNCFRNQPKCFNQ